MNHGFGARGYIVEFEANSNPVPESSAVGALLLAGFAGLFGLRRRIEVA